jgi:hypothetical protein
VRSEGIADICLSAPRQALAAPLRDDNCTRGARRGARAIFHDAAHILHGVIRLRSSAAAGLPLRAVFPEISDAHADIPSFCQELPGTPGR